MTPITTLTANRLVASHAGYTIDEPASTSIRNTTAMHSASTSMREKNPCGRRRVLRRQRSQIGTGRWNVVSVPPMPKYRVTRVSCTSLTQLRSPQLQQNDDGKLSGGPPTSMPSLHRRHDEFGAAGSLGPTARHGLEPRVKTHAFHAVHRVIGEARATPAAEAHERHGHRDRQVYANHAAIDMLD